MNREEAREICESDLLLKQTFSLETRDLVYEFRRVFVNRSDTYAVQLATGGYSRELWSLTDDVLVRHLKGEITVGAYQLNEDNLVKWLVFDLDPEHLNDPLETARSLLRVAIERVHERAVLLEASRYPDPSYHIWVLFEPELHAKAARWLGLRILKLAGVDRSIEVFPKQESLTQGREFGNLVKLPLGLHQVKRKWSRFLDFETFQPRTTPLQNAHGISFSQADIRRMMRAGEKQSVPVYELPKSYKDLNDEDEKRTVEALAKYWLEGYRNDLEYSFLGFCLKRGVSFESAYRVIDAVTEITGDEERAARLELVKYHYRNRRGLGTNLKGLSGIREVIFEVLKRGLVG